MTPLRLALRQALDQPEQTADLESVLAEWVDPELLEAALLRSRRMRSMSAVPQLSDDVLELIVNQNKACHESPVLQEAFLSSVVVPPRLQFV